MFKFLYKYPFYICHRGMSRNKKVLNVAEKNDAAKNIAELLSRGRSRRSEGLSKFNKIYEFQFEIGQVSQLSVLFVAI